MTDGHKDQDHLETVIYSKTGIPDRTNFLLGKSNDNPVFLMIEAAKQLEELSVSYIAIPCITAHYFYYEISSKLKTPLIDAVDETLLYLKEYGINTVGLMATRGTIATDLFQAKAEDYGIKIIVPDEYEQDCIDNIINNNIKANKPIDIEKFDLVSNNLRSKGANIIVLGCSELSIIKRNYDIGKGYLDTMEVLARHCIKLCNVKLKQEYECLIDKEYD